MESDTKLVIAPTYISFRRPQFCCDTVTISAILPTSNNHLKPDYGLMKAAPATD
jgi:hypothetical protein